MASKPHVVKRPMMAPVAQIRCLRDTIRRPWWRICDGGGSSVGSSQSRQPKAPRREDSDARWLRVSMGIDEEEAPSHTCAEADAVAVVVAMVVEALGGMP